MDSRREAPEPYRKGNAPRELGLNVGAWSPSTLRRKSSSSGLLSQEIDSIVQPVSFRPTRRPGGCDG